MKLQTSIPPRRDGTLNVTGLDGKTYAFTKGEDGELSGDVTDEATVAHLLAGGMFYPADPADFEAALKMAQTEDEESEEGESGDEGQGQGEGESESGEGTDESEDGEEGGEGSEGGEQSNALPVEANTPPKAPKAPKTGNKRGGGK